TPASPECHSRSGPCAPVLRSRSRRAGRGLGRLIIVCSLFEDIQPAVDACEPIVDVLTQGRDIALEVSFEFVEFRIHAIKFAIHIPPESQRYDQDRKIT